MKRWVGLVDDPTAGGSTLDTLAAMPAGAAAIAAPDLFVPVTSAQADPGIDDLERSSEVRGVRANTAPVAFRRTPSFSLEALAYPKLLRRLLPKAFSGTPSSTGSAPAAITSTIPTLTTGSLKALILWLVREGQLDRQTGAVISEIALGFDMDSEGTVSVEFESLYHKTDDSASAIDPNGHAAAAYPAVDFTGQTADTFMLRDAASYYGGSLTEFINFAGFGLTFNNGLISEPRSQFRPNKNVLRVTDGAGALHKLWYRQRHKPGAQVVSGRVDFSDVDAALENKRIITQAEKLVFEVAAGPLGTTPAADEMMRLNIYNKVFSGGGADPIQREGDQVAGYDFVGYLDPSTGKDIDAVFVGATAIV